MSPSSKRWRLKRASEWEVVTVAEKRKCLERLTWGEDGAVRMMHVDAPTIAHNVGASTIVLGGSKQFTDEKQISCFT
jgi:hypothetical protein